MTPQAAVTQAAKEAEKKMKEKGGWKGKYAPTNSSMRVSKKELLGMLYKRPEGWKNIKEAILTDKWEAKANPPLRTKLATKDKGRLQDSCALWTDFVQFFNCLVTDPIGVGTRSRAVMPEGKELSDDPDFPL